MWRRTYGRRGSPINAVECKWKTNPTNSYNYSTRKHTHTQCCGTSSFVTKATKRVKSDALPARFVTTWWQNMRKGPLAARFVTPSPATLQSAFTFPRCVCVYPRARVCCCAFVHGSMRAHPRVLLSPPQSALNWNSVLLWEYEATAARSSVSCVKYDHRYRDWVKMWFDCVLWMSRRYIIDWMAGMVWWDRR